jgi:hypothetical protein
MQEKWKGIKGFENEYQVSDQGRIKSLARLVGARGGSTRLTVERILSPGNNKGAKRKHGYLWVMLRRPTPDGIELKKQYVHRLVLQTFEGDKPGLQVNHRNGITTDPRLSNLEWMTQAQNVRHKVLNGLTCRGADHPSSKVTDDQVREIRAIGKTQSRRKIGETYGISAKQVGRILTRSRREWVV